MNQSREPATTDLRYASDERPSHGLSALLQAIPPPVAGAFIMILLVLLFAHGVRLIASGGLPYENGTVVGLAFWLGVGFQGRAIFPEALPDRVRSLLDNGMTAGGIVAFTLSWLLT